MSKSVNWELLFDADEYRRAGGVPWTFFACPTALATADGLPPDEDARKLLAEVLYRGIEVAVWESNVVNNTTYFACKQSDIKRLTELVVELEATILGRNFCAQRSEELFARWDDRSNFKD